MKRTTVEIKKSKIVLVGNGPTGFKFCEKFVKYRLAKQYDLVVYGEESYPAYDRINLTRFFSVNDVKDLYLAPLSWYDNNGITLKRGTQIVQINKEEKWIKTAAGNIEKYDKLILATGSFPFVPAGFNLEIKGVFVYRSIADLEAIKQLLIPEKKAIVIGGGILGLEAARALLNAGMLTTVIEMGNHIMARQLDAAGAAVLSKQIEALGVKIVCGQYVTHATGKDGIEQVTLKNGAVYDADLVVISAGIRPRDELAKAAGISVDAAGGITVNNYNLTSDENIYAIGECARIEGRIWGLAAPCYEMVEIVAARFAKIYKVFTGNILFTKLKILETKVITFGDALGEHEPSTAIVYQEDEEGIYKRINISEDGQYIIGGILVGQTNGYATLLQMTRNKIKLSGKPEDLINDSVELNQQSILVMPDNMVICLCEGVCKSTIITAIKENSIVRLDQLKNETRAGTGCESCIALLEDFIAEAVHNNDSI